MKGIQWPVYILWLLLLSACRGDRPAPEAASTEPGQPGKLICFGDDFVAGFGLQPAENFPGLLRHYIDSLGYKWRVVNAGIAGETSSGGNERVEWVLQRGVDVFVIMLGYNDAAAGISHRGTYENLLSIVNKVKNAAPRARILLVAPPTPPGAGPAFDEVFTSLASAEGLTLMQNFGAGIRGNLNLLLPDGVHPNARGIRRLVDQNLWPVLQPVLEERGGEVVR